MGQRWTNFANDNRNLYDGVNATKRDVPYNFENPSFDPNYGFPQGRKKREMIATPEQMKLAKIEPEYQDYCAHLLIKFQMCRRDKAPFYYRCEHEKHTYLTCEYEDYVMRMKEFEREKRLRARERRLLAAAAN